MMLEVAMQTTIKTLYRQGYNKTQIGNMLGIDRKTVRKILNEFSEGKEVVEKKPHPSQFDPYREFILIQLSKDLSITRIHQDLIAQYGAAGSYTSLKDYIKKIRPNSQKAYMVLHSLAGEEAQVDFGYIGTLKVNGKSRKAWIFVMALSYSRYLYAEIAFDQNIKTFIACHANAFRYFGGIPETVKTDNLKAAVIEADFYEPVTQRTYAAFAVHYGFLPNHCRVYTPTDKGKVESNVKYIKDNCFKGREFEDLEEAREFLSSWLDTVANARKHGTTGKVPRQEFLEKEREKLRKLPKEDFIFSKSAKAAVNTDCHISYGANYYSVPYGYIGCEVDVIEINSLLKIYFAGKEIALHALEKNKKGAHVTDRSHYPVSKTITREEILSSYREKMGQIGEGALEFLRRYLSESTTDTYYRSIAGILSLRKRFDSDTLNKACLRACHYGSISYRTVKKICETGMENLPLFEAASGADTPESTNIRSLSEYRMMTELGVIRHE